MLQLVDPHGQTIGLMEKLSAHENGGQLHRAVSVVLLNQKGQMLVQQRAAFKYHFVGKWANASCTHPHLQETPIEAGNRALSEELGIRTSLSEVTRLIYLAHDPESGYTEQEYDHVLLGYWDGSVYPNPFEVTAVRWLDPQALKREIEADPDQFAFWFRQILTELSSLAEANGLNAPELQQFMSQLMA